MANLVLLDSFDHYDSATSAYKSTNGLTVTASGRTNKGAEANMFSAPVYNFSRITNACMGFAYKTTVLQNGFRFTNPLGAPAGLTNVGDGRLMAFYGNPYTYGDPTDVRLSVGTWYYIEFKALPSWNVGPPPTSTLTYEIRVNEESLITGAITVSASGWSEYGFTGIELNGPGGGFSCFFDDIYVTEGELLGDLRIYVIRPDGDSAPSLWTPNTPASHYTKVNDIVPDGDTGYLYSITDGQQDMVTLEDIVLTGEIRGIQGNTIAQKDDAGGSVIRTEYVISATPYEVADDKYLTYLSWRDHRDPMRLNPVTGVAFTVDEINAMTMGVKRIV